MPIILVRIAAYADLANAEHWKLACAAAPRLAPGFPGQAQSRSGQGWDALVVRVNQLDPTLISNLEHPGTILISSLAKPQWPHASSAALGFAMVIEESERRLRAVCDLMGSQSLYWYAGVDEFWVSSRIELLLHAPGITRAPDSGYFAAYYAGSQAGDESTAYRDIRVLPAGAQMDWSNGRAHVTRQDRCPDSSLWTLPVADLEVRMRDHLDQAVRSSIALSTPSVVGLLLSGGFDSASILGSLVQQRSRFLELHCATAGYHHAQVIDERIPALSLRSYLKTPGFEVDAATHPPDLELMVDRAAPCANPFRSLNDALYGGLRAAGAQLILTGQFADELDAPGLAWYREWRVRSSVGLPLLVPMIRGLPLLFARLLHRLRPRWLAQAEGLNGLRPEWQAQVALIRASALELQGHWPRPAHAAAVLGSGCVESELLETRHYEKVGALVRHPYRNWELVRFMLSLPAKHTAVVSSSKLLQRRALSAYLPSQFIQQKKCGSLEPLLHAALKHDFLQIARLLDETPVWREYLRDEARDCVQLRNSDDLHLLCLILGHVLWSHPELLRKVGDVAGHRQQIHLLRNVIHGSGVKARQ